MATPGTALKKYCITGFPGKNTPITDDVAQGLLTLENSLGMPIWVLIQNGSRFDSLSKDVKQTFVDSQAGFAKGEKIALIVDSPGGEAKYAYQIGRFLKKHCNGFVAIVPDYAKSAATLLVLAAEKIIMGPHAELGPLDVQIFDPEREEYSSALNEVQALDRLNAFAMQAIDTNILLLGRRSMMTTKSLLPGIQKFVADMMRPLLEKIDTVHYTQSSRNLKVAEEYATRLLKPKYDAEAAARIARALVHKYPEHGFMIDAEEARSIQLEISDPDATQEAAMDLINRHTKTGSFVGKFQEV